MLLKCHACLPIQYSIEGTGSTHSLHLLLTAQITCFILLHNCMTDQSRVFLPPPGSIGSNTSHLKKVAKTPTFGQHRQTKDILFIVFCFFHVWISNFASVHAPCSQLQQLQRSYQFSNLKYFSKWNDSSTKPPVVSFFSFFFLSTFVHQPRPFQCRLQGADIYHSFWKWSTKIWHSAYPPWMAGF